MPIQIVITLDDNGHVGINAPLQDKILCYGLLEMARAAIDKHQPPTQNGQNGQAKILRVPPGTIVPKLPKSHQ